MNKQGFIILALLCLFACSVSAQTRVEYWFDNDPGQGHATALSVNSDTTSMDISTEALSYGWHTAGIRVQQRRWSQTYTHRFYKAAPTTAAGEVNGAEYWVDNDPGQGNATALPFTAGQTQFALDIPTDSMESGFHISGLRVRYGEKWSQTYTHRFFVPASKAETELTAAEYWLDEDPGRGQALPLAISAGQEEISMDVLQTDTLAEGYHVLGLRVRYGDTWSQTYTHRFLRSAKQIIPTQVEAIEAFWDGDTTQIIVVPYSQNGDSVVIEGYDFDTQALSYGIHYLYLHAKVNGVWSILSRYEICKNAIPQFSVLDEESVCVGQEVIILDESAEVQSETTYKWDMNGDGNTDYTTRGDFIHTYTKAGTYTITLTVQTGTGCESVYSKEIYVHPTATPTDPTSVENALEDGLRPEKILINGQIYILRGDKVYTVTGQEMK